MNLEKFFNPGSIAIIGASEEAGKVGQAISKNILDLGYNGQVFLVNQKYDTLFGQKCYRSLLEIKEPVDLAIMAIPAKVVNQVIRENADKIKNWVVVSAGFSEINTEGRTREEELGKLALEKGLQILGPNCLGFIIPRLKLNASFSSGLPRRGGISFVTQSGALAVAIMDSAKKENLKFSNIVSIGNKMQIEETRLLEYLEKDKSTKVIGMYLEGIKDGKSFVETVKHLKKPLVVLKAGKSEKAQKAISSHTGSLAGDDKIMDAVFKSVGIIRAKDIDEFLSFLKLASKIKAPRNEKVIIVTNAGGLGVLTTDAFSGKRIKLAEITPETREELKNFLPEESSLSNPIDLLGDADEIRYAKALSTLEKEEADTLICLLTPQNQTPVEKIAQVISNFKKETDKKIITVFMGGERVAKGVKILGKNSLANYFLPDQAVRALDEYYGWKLDMEDGRKKKKPEKNSGHSRASEIIQKAKREGRALLNFREAKEIMEAYSIETVDFADSSKAEELEKISYPVVIKVDSEKVLHKTDQGGLKLNLKNREELEAAVSKMRTKFPEEKLIIQTMIESGTELILGMKRDPVFGPIIVMGLGGIYTEVFQMIDLLMPETDEELIQKRMLESKIGFLFQGARGQSPYNLKELSKIIANFSGLVLSNSQISEIDINPLMAYNTGASAKAVDIKILIDTENTF